MSVKETATALGTVREDDEREQRRRALRALVQMPLLTASGPHAEEFMLVRRHEDALKKWFSHHTGWTLQVATDFARLRKVPADLTDATFPAREPKQQVAFTRRRYVFLCLALAALERNARQTTLSDLAGAIIEALDSDPIFAARGIALDLSDIHHRRDIVAVVRYIIERQVLTPRHGDEEQYIRDQRNNVLYSINRPVLSALLCVQRGPSTVDTTDCTERIAAITAELTARTDEGRNRRLHHSLLRRLLEQPIVYYSDLSDGERDLLSNRRARLLQYLEDATGLVAEVRAEGIALLDESEDFTDLVLATEGTDGHATLLLAEFLGTCAREREGETIGLAELHTMMTGFIEQHRSRWRKIASQPGAEIALTQGAIERLAALQLVRVFPSGVLPMPAICRYRLGAVESEPTLL
jgi:uncharacterized protein (TIGR02678 family)